MKCKYHLAFRILIINLIRILICLTQVVIEKDKQTELNDKMIEKIIKVPIETVASSQSSKELED